MDEIPDILDQLKAACFGHPHVRIPWPHRLLHAAIAEIEQLRAALLAEREAATKAERERCKAEAEKVQDRDLLGASSDYSAGHFVACGRILAAIRSGARP